MVKSTTLPVIGGLGLVAILCGVSLGRAAIGEINPVYFQPAPSHFYSDLVPNRGSGTGQADLDSNDYLQADYAYSAAPTCTDCGNYPIDVRPIHDKAVDGIDDGWSASAPPLPEETTLASRQEPRADPPPANRAWVERYMDYTVSAEPAAHTDDAAQGDPAADSAALPAETN